MSQYYELVAVYRSTDSNSIDCGKCVCCLLFLVVLIPIILPIIAVSSHFLEQGNINYQAICDDGGYVLNLTSTYKSSGWSTKIHCDSDGIGDDTNCLCQCLCGPIYTQESMTQGCEGDDSSDIKFVRSDYYESKKTKRFWTVYNYFSIAGIFLWMIIYVLGLLILPTLCQEQELPRKCICGSLFVVIIGLCILGAAMSSLITSASEHDTNANSNQQIVANYLSETMAGPQCVNMMLGCSDCVIDTNSVSIEPTTHYIAIIFGVLMLIEVLIGLLTIIALKTNTTTM